MASNDGILDGGNGDIMDPASLGTNHNDNVPSKAMAVEGPDISFEDMPPPSPKGDSTYDVAEIITNINQLAFKRDPPVAKGPYYSTKVEYVAMKIRNIRDQI